ncbi:MAG: hypothetical protein AAGL49_09645, partial [Pseudomonadota bacterium]
VGAPRRGLIGALRRGRAGRAHAAPPTHAAAAARTAARTRVAARLPGPPFRRWSRCPLIIHHPSAFDAA